MTLEDLVLTVGAEVEAARVARCPVCHEHQLELAGCGSCGSVLSR